MSGMIVRQFGDVLSDLKYFELLDRQFKKIYVLDDCELGLGEECCFVVGKSHYTIEITY